jgi:hypothetical protein
VVPKRTPDQLVKQPVGQTPYRSRYSCTLTSYSNLTLAICTCYNYPHAAKLSL